MRILDPYLEKLTAMDLKLEEMIFETLMKAANKDYILNFLNTPTWALTKVYERAPDLWGKGSVLRHPNCDQKLVAEAIALDSSELLTGVVHNPSLSREQLNKLLTSKNESVANWAKFYLLKNTSDVEQFILAELNKQPEDRNIILSQLIRDTKLPENVVSILIRDHLKEVTPRYTTENQIGDLLRQNPQLTSENKVELHLLGVEIKEKSPETLQYLPSSYLFRLEIDNHSDERIISGALALSGHPFALLITDNKVENVELSDLNLFQLVQSELLHRIFWRELEGIDGFELTFRNGFDRVSDFFISHEVLGREFDESDFEEGWRCGGVLPGYEDRDWIDKEVSIDPDFAPRILTNSADSLLEIIEYRDSFSEMYPAALAYLMDEDYSNGRLNKFGIRLNQSASEVVEIAALEAAEYGDLDIDVSFNPHFHETLSWTNLSLAKKIGIFNLLVFGLSCHDEKLRLDAQHFLGCIALHPETPVEIKTKLRSLNIVMVNDILDRLSI